MFKCINLHIQGLQKVRCVSWQADQYDAVGPRCFNSRDGHVAVVVVHEQENWSFPAAVWNED